MAAREKMKAYALLGGVLIGAVTMAGAQTCCFCRHCAQTPNLNFTAAHDYEHLPQFVVSVWSLVVGP